MAVTVNRLYKNGAFLYKMILLAGKSGLTNPVSWVHIIEDDTVTTFLHGNELVFTAGILNRERDWLLSFAHRLHQADVSALVVNLGPHTADVDEAVIDYCNLVGLPLFTIPWQTRMVDMTRDFCHRIMHDEQVENTLVTTMKNILFQVGDPETQVLQMERHGFQRNSTFCFLAVGAEGYTGDPEELRSALKACAENTARDRSELFLSFTYNDCRVIVLADHTDDEITAYVERFTRSCARRLVHVRLFVGASSNQPGIYHQIANFEKSLSALQMATRRNEDVVYYDKLGVYKMLYAVADKAALRGYYQETVGAVEKYDRENGTQLLPLLQDYLRSNDGLQQVAERHYVHRNTVTNQLRRVQEITGLCPFEMEDKLKLCLGFYIADIL